MARGGGSSNQNQFQAIASPSHSLLSNNTVVGDDVQNPYFLHSGDHPGLILVTHVLTGNNYNTWIRAMQMALNAKNKLGFVDGSIAQSHATDPLARTWSHYNSMVLSWVLNAVTKEIADSLLYLDTAQAVWLDLCDRFQQSNAPRIFQLKQMMNGPVQGSFHINTYYTKLKTMWDELKNTSPHQYVTVGE